jgi:hypothetical protein
MIEEEYPFDEETKSAEEKHSWQDDHVELPPNDIVAYNELRSCADILRMYKSNQLIIQPDFQRDVVWKKPDQTRFIDSLIKQLPIPSMCISLDFKSNERLVIDGLQRISTIISFLDDINFELSDLEDVDSKISGKSVKEIKKKHKSFYERVENLTIPITVIRCDYSKKSHMDYLFTIFHRLNSGGAKLNNQEIRNCIYNGNFNTLLKNTVKYNNYIKLFNIKDNKTYRFAFEEMNLRFFALSEKLDKYNGRLAKFLNEYMYEMQKTTKLSEGGKKLLDEKQLLFERTIDTLYLKIFNSTSIEKLSKAVVEALLIATGKNLNYLDGLTQPQASELFTKLKAEPQFSADSLKEGLSQKSKVTSRINRAIEIFSGN